MQEGLLRKMSLVSLCVERLSLEYQGVGLVQVMILTLDKEKGRVSLSTKKLEPTPGDMVRDPALVYARADEMAAAFR